MDACLRSAGRCLKAECNSRPNFGTWWEKQGDAKTTKSRFCGGINKGKPIKGYLKAQHIFWRDCIGNGTEEAPKDLVRLTSGFWGLAQTGRFQKTVPQKRPSISSPDLQMKLEEGSGARPKI